MKQYISGELQKTRTDEKQLWDIYSGNFAYKTLLVAHDLKPFPLLAKKTLTLAEVCEDLHVNRRGAEALLRMLVSMGLLQIQDECYSPISLAKDYLIESSPTYFGGFLNIAIAIET